MKRSMLISIVLAMTALPLWSQQPPPAEPMHGQEGMQHMHDMAGMKPGQPTDEEAMMAQCQAMMAKHEAIQAEIEAAQQRLDALVAKMNAASGDEKVDAMAAVVEELVARQRLHQSEMMEMHPQMMHHMMHPMMEHMPAMGESGSMGAMMDCPMMKEMKKGMMKEGMEPGEASGSPQPSDEPSKHHPPR